jgi:very-short-patch-repair endonuclease
MYNNKNTTMEIIKTIENKQIHIIINASKESLFKASDIGNILEIKNIRQNLSQFDDSEKVIRQTYTLGGNQNITFLTVKGLKRIVCNSHKPMAIDLAKKLDIDLIDFFYVPLESSLVHFLQTVYKDEKLIHQYKVDPYKIDLYFPDYNLAIECDEYLHIFQKEDETKREKYIKDKLDCEFIRFKQNKKNEYLPELINKINKIIEKNKLTKYRYEIRSLNTKLDIYDYNDHYNTRGTYDYISEFGLRDIGYETPPPSSP